MSEIGPKNPKRAGNPHIVAPGPIARRAWLSLAWICVGLASAGVVLPLVPTTPFLLVAAWAAARSSPELHAWIFQHPHFGPLLRDWQAHRALRPRVKLVALLLIAASWVVILGTVESPIGRGGASLTLLTVAIFLATRPNGPPRIDSPIEARQGSEPRGRG